MDSYTTGADQSVSAATELNMFNANAPFATEVVIFVGALRAGNPRTSQRTAVRETTLGHL